MTIPNILFPNTSTSSMLEERSTVNIMNVLSSVIASVGVIANFTVVSVFVSNAKLRRKIPNIYIINQSLLDFAVSVILLLKNLTVKDTFIIHNSGLHGEVECLLWNSDLFLWGLFDSSTWNLVQLTIERYLELVHPIWHKTHFKKYWIFIGIFINWFYGITIIAAHKLPTTKVVNGLCYLVFFWPSSQHQKAVGIFLVVEEFFIPLLIMTYCYGRIIHVLSKRNDKKVHSSDNQTDQFQKAKINTIKTFLIISICFVICWANNQVLYLLYNLGYGVDWDGVYVKFGILMAFGNCTINPFLYLIKYRDYQEGLKACFCSRNPKMMKNTKNFKSISSIS